MLDDIKRGRRCRQMKKNREEWNTRSVDTCHQIVLLKKGNMLALVDILKLS